MDLKEQFIDFFRHYRHDWLNHIQIIKGYVSMGKIDELSRFLDQLVIKTYEDSQLSQLGNTELAYFLLTYNWMQNKIQLEVEIETDKTEEIALIGKNYPFLFKWIKHGIEIVEDISLAGEENKLFLVFIYKEEQLHIHLNLAGCFQSELVEEKLNKLDELAAEDQGKLVLHIHNQDELSFDLIAEHPK